MGGNRKQCFHDFTLFSLFSPTLKTVSSQLGCREGPQHAFVAEVEKIELISRRASCSPLKYAARVKYPHRNILQAQGTTTYSSTHIHSAPCDNARNMSFMWAICKCGLLVRTSSEQSVVCREIFEHSFLSIVFVLGTLSKNLLQG